MVPARASILTSPLLTLGRPNLPATKNGTEVPLIGTGTCQTVGERSRCAAAEHDRASHSPPMLPVICTLTVGEVAPDGLVTRIRHGDGAHETNRALGFTLLLICNSTFIVLSGPPYPPWYEKTRSHEGPDPSG